MTPVFCCGFECGVIDTDLGQHWVTVAGTAQTFSTSTVRSGARSMRFNLSGTNALIRPPLFTSSNHIIIRFYIQFATLPTADYILLQIGSPASGIIFQQSDNKLYLHHTAGATIGTGGVTVTTGQWYRIDYWYNGSGGSGVQDMQVDGVAVNQLSGGTTGSFTELRFGNTTNNTAEFFLDDFILCLTSGDYPIGAGYINHFIPTADGTHNIAGTGDFQRTLTGTDILNATTTAFQLVDDVPLETGSSVDWINMVAPPNATDYVECIFGPAPGISTPTVGPRTIEIIAAVHQAGTATGNMQIRLNDNGTMGTIYSATGGAGTTTIRYKRVHFLDPPSAASVWHANNDGSNGDFRDLRVRFGSPAAVDANPDQYLDCIMIEAEFAEVVSVFPAAYDRTTEQPYKQKRLITGELLGGAFFFFNPISIVANDKVPDWQPKTNQPFFPKKLHSPTGLKASKEIAIDFDTDALSFLSAAAITDPAQRRALNALVVSAKANGWWALCNAIYPIVGGSAASHKFNLKDPQDTDGAFRLTFSGSITHSATGILPTALSVFADTHLNPSTVLTQENTHYSFYSRTNSQKDFRDCGTDAAQLMIILARNTSDNSVARSTAAGAQITVANSDSRGHFIASRISTTSFHLFKNGVSLSENTTSTTNTLPNDTFCFLAGGSGGFDSPQREIAFATIGASISPAIAILMYQDIQAFQTRLNRQV